MADKSHSVIGQLGNEIIQWRQTNLEEWYTGNIETMDQAVEAGRYILQMRERTQIALGQLFNHVEKHKGGGGLKGGCRELGRRLNIPRLTYWTWMKGTSTKELAERSASLGISKVALIEGAPEPEAVSDWHDAQEEPPTYREIKDFIDIQHFETITRPSQAEGEYNVVVIDPPWKYDLGYDHRHARAGVPSYPTMSLEELETLHIPAAKDCALFLWVTNQMLREGFHLLEHWGFEYKGIITWAKDKTGTGRWFLNQTEHVLLGIKGKVLWQRGQSNLIHAGRREHSRKPDEFYDLVERLVTHGSRIDMFSRESRDGWKQWGAEVEAFNFEKGTETPKDPDAPPHHTDIGLAGDPDVVLLLGLQRIKKCVRRGIVEALPTPYSAAGENQLVKAVVTELMSLVQQLAPGTYERRRMPQNLNREDTET